MDLQLRTRKFFDPEFTATGARRARVDLLDLRTLWFNTGTLCNLTCNNCYIHSSPTNDNLVYLNIEEVTDFISEISVEKYETTEIGFTGGEPFLKASCQRPVPNWSRCTIRSIALRSPNNSTLVPVSVSKSYWLKKLMRYTSLPPRTCILNNSVAP